MKKITEILRKKQGTTMVEMMVTLLLISIMMTMAVSSLSSASHIFMQVQKTQYAQSILDTVMTELRAITKNASSYIKIYENAKNIANSTGNCDGNAIEFINEEGYAVLVSTDGCDDTELYIGDNVIGTAKAVEEGQLLTRYYFVDGGTYTYEKDGALWLKSTDYGDDKDRVIIRDNGVPTYLAADIAYHKNKYERGFRKMINIWGADHHGYVARVKASMAALGYDPSQLEVLLLQMVSLFRDGKPVKMSKRTGQAITLNELIEEVGTDAARYFFIMRSLDTQLDFDLDLAKSHSNENPVYYIQYAHARIYSIYKQIEEAGGTIPEDWSDVVWDTLQEPQELELIKKMAAFPEEIQIAARERAPHRIAHFAHELASLFHNFYNHCHVIQSDKDLEKARLALVTAVRITIAGCLAILGVSAPEKM